MIIHLEKFLFILIQISTLDLFHRKVAWVCHLGPSIPKVHKLFKLITVGPYLSTCTRNVVCTLPLPLDLPPC
jgi:hypothetical protein